MPGFYIILNIKHKEVLSMLEDFKNMISEICIDEKIEYREFSNGWIIELKKGNSINYITGMRFPLNSYSVATILNDKYATYTILKNNNVPIIEHKILFNPKTRKGYISDFASIKDIKQYFKKQSNGTVIVKANEGSGGKEVYKCRSFKEICCTINKIFKTKDSVSICPFYNIAYEHRLIYLNGQCKLAFIKKNRVGSWKHNLAQGAEVYDETDEKKLEKLKEIANRVVKILNCNFVSVDIAETVDNDLLVMEVNASVSMTKYASFSEANRSIAKNIYKEAISFSLEENIL